MGALRNFVGLVASVGGAVGEQGAAAQRSLEWFGKMVAGALPHSRSQPRESTSTPPLRRGSHSSEVDMLAA